MRSSFASFTTGLLGMRTSQYALDITGHNISNINTTGYTRQRTDQYSMALTSGGSHWEARIGMGVNISGISQIRNPYLDVRFRNEVAQVGYSDATLAGLEDLQSILDEVGLEAGILTEFDNFASQLSKLAVNLDQRELENLVRSSADTLTKLINQYAKSIEISRADTEENFHEQDIPQLNGILSKIQDLSVSIEKNQASGNPSLELLDERNILIDQLANHMKIKVTYTPKKIAGTERTVDQLNIDFLGGDGTKICRLIEGTGQEAQFKSETVNGKMTLSVTPVNPNLPQDALGGYPPLKESAISTVNDLLQQIADFNGLTTQSTEDIAAKEQEMTDQWAVVTEAQNALKTAGPDADRDALQKAIDDAKAAYDALKQERNDLRQQLADQQKNRLPVLQELQKHLPDARFKEKDGNLVVTYTYAKQNYTLVDGSDIAEFSSGTDGDRNSLLLQDVNGDAPVQLGKYPQVAQDKLKTVNGTLKQMQLLEEKITKALSDNPGMLPQNNPYLMPDPNSPDPANPVYIENTAQIAAERQQLFDNLEAAMPNSNLTAGIVNGKYQVSLSENGSDYLLIDGDIPAAQFNIINNSLMLSQANPPEDPIDVTDNMSDGSLKGTMELLNSSGLFDNDANATKGFGYYSKMLDTLAITFANTFNEVNKLLTDENGDPIKDDQGNTIGGPLFGSSDGQPITAANICVHVGWASGEHGLVATRNYKNGDKVNTGVADNLLHMENLLTNLKTDFPKNPVDGTISDLAPGEGAFSGTFRECFENINSMLGTDIATNKAILDNHVTVANDVSNNIDQYSGVSLDEEGVNMMRFQKSLTAAMRFMTTIDEALNSIINNMGLVGR